MLQTLYYIIIYPIEFIVDLVFTLMNKWLDKPGLSIIAVSIVINFLILPMYKRSDALQEQERANQASMSNWVSRIRKTFKGDERFMMLSEYYRQNHYKPIYALRGSISLLLQIPFFIAAYHYLSNLSVLSGTSFLGISDLSRPDSLLSFGSFSVNVLPVLMTLINFISGAIYTKGFPKKDKIQLYAMACIFLVFLYGSPSGLVLYWTCNNLFSLFKNIFYKKLLPLLRLRPAKKKVKNDDAENALHSRPALFLLGSLLITLLTGILIPSSVIVSSPAEFVPTYSYADPLRFLGSSVSIAAGLFLVWGGILYYLMKDGLRQKTERMTFVLSGIFLTDYMFFGRKLGNLSSMLYFDDNPVFTAGELVTNILVLLAVAAVFLFLWKKLKKAVPVILSVLIVSTVFLGGVNVYKTNGQMQKLSYLKEKNESRSAPDSVFHLSRNGKNVIVLMLDRAISGYVPYMLNEKPELKEAFSGFTYYPNTVTFGMHTLFGAPPLFGGYEYTPSAMNSRTNEPLSQKVNESLKVMPKLFSDAGYDVTVCDPPYAGYDDSSVDLSIYSSIPNVHAYTLLGKYTDENNGVLSDAVLEKGKTYNFFRYSIFKVLPLFLQPGFYDNGFYLSSDTSEEDGSRISDFLRSFSVLSKFRDLTKIENDDRNYFLMMDNESTHNPCTLQLPDYTLTSEADNSKYLDSWREQFSENGVVKVHMDTTTQQGHYFINMASFLQLSKWFDYLKEQNVYDNTRIILVSDHGFSMGQFDSLLPGGGLPDVEGYNPLLMVKDFSSKESSTSENFMTNADVPELAVKDIIASPVNPYTKKKLDGSEKNSSPQELTTSDHFYVKDHPGAVFNTGDGEWFSVHDSIFDAKNWKKLDTK